MPREDETRQTFKIKVEEHGRLLRKRGFPMAAEHYPPIGQAAHWYQDMICYMPRSGRDVGRQIARLCGDDSVANVSWRSLSDAVGKVDKAGRPMAYTQRGVKCLTDGSWLQKQTIGSGSKAQTFFYLMPGEIHHASWAYGQVSDAA